jgi:thiol-disulfide isomerase/thioredoxin
MRILLILLFSTSLACADSPLSVGDTATNWTLQSSETESLDYYQDSKGKVSVILFWATWCPYCARLMPHLQEVYQEYKDEGLKFYAIDIFEDGDIDPIKHFDEKGFTYTLLLEGDEVARKYGVKGTPAVYVVGKDKQVVYKRPAGVSDVMVKQNVELRIRQALAK